ncbi:hypothetical protein [Pseudaeromonas paramecii]|uniref:Lipoprotein n=1 Tax=Pseudaeromonas paramecii TaxID=2138166 RepID=A0ABP8PXG0_9GAMM
MMAWCLPLVAGGLLLGLTACSDDDNQSGENSARQAYLSTNAGLYSGGAVVDNQALRWQLAVTVQGALLTQYDDRDQASSQSGEVVEDGLSFADGSRCLAQAGGFTCNRDTLALSLSGPTSPDAVTVESLAGSYQLVHGSQLGSLSLASDGTLSGQLGECVLGGQLQGSGALLVLTALADSCGSSDSLGLLLSDSVGSSQHDVQQVLLPGSPLGGYWVRLAE